jgi:dolichol-phosphate mannosyltransferase
LVVSIIIPAYEEGDSLRRTISNLYSTCRAFEFEVVVVIDSEFDASAKIVKSLQTSNNFLRLLVQDSKGPLNAINYGIRNTIHEFIIILTADDTDDISDIPKMVECFEDGAQYVTASRYITGGSYVGGPKVKRVFSKTASKCLELRHGEVASDPTNGFKGFSRNIYMAAKIKGDVGFTYGLQLLGFALTNGVHLAVIPTRWHDRIEGASSFKMFKWMPAYLYWFLRVLFIRTTK